MSWTGWSGYFTFTAVYGQAKHIAANERRNELLRSLLSGITVLIRQWKKDKGNKKRVHAIRLSLKKIDVITKLGSRQDARTFDRFIKPGFKQLGDLRKLQVTYALLKKNHASGALLKQARKKRDEARDEVQKHLKRTLRNIQKGVEVLVAASSSGTPQQAVVEMTNELNGLVKARHRKAMAHELRKHIKAIVLISGFDGSHIKFHGIRQFRLLDKLIGQWHDLQQARKYIARMDHGDKKTLRSLSSQETNAFAGVRKELKATREIRLTSVAVHQ